MSPYSDPTPIATSGEYVTALRRMRDSFKRGKPFSDSPELKMLRLHYAAAEHTVTATQLAAHVALASFTAANLRYGTLGRNIAQLLEKTVAPLKSTKIPHWWRVLGYCKDDADFIDNSEVEWVMRPELCEALEQLGWVKSEQYLSRDTDLTPF